MAYTPLDWKTIQANATEIQRRQRRAKELRNQQEGYKKLAATPGEGRHYAPTQQGGLYETVAQYHKDYSGAGNKIAGMLGNWLTGGQAETAEQAAEQMRNEEVLRAVQQHSDPNRPTGPTGPASMNEALGIQPASPSPPPSSPIQGMGGGLAAAGAPGATPPPPQGMAPGMGAGLAAAGIQPEAQPPADLMAALGMPEPGAASGMEAAIAQDPAPTQETLRAYLGLIGGPDVDVDSLLGTNKNAPHVQSREHGTDGFVHALMSDGSTRKTDIKFDSSVMLVQDQDPNSATKGQYIPISKWSSGHQGQDPPEDWPRKTVQAIDAPLGTLPGEEGTTPAPAATTPAGTLDREALHQAQMKQESAGDPNAVSPMGAFGPMQLMPETAAVLEERAGLVPGASKDPAINERLGKQHMDELLTKYNGDQEMALIAYNRGEPNADAWAKGDPAKGIAPRDRSLLPAETQGYVQKILGGAQPAQGAQGAQPAAPARAATPFRTLTQAEIAGETERQKSLAKREMADTDAETQALIESAKTTGIELSKAQVAKYTGSKAARSKFDTVMGQSNIALDRLVSADGQMHPGLKGLTPETITGWFDPDKKWQRNALAKLNPKAAEALAYIEEIAGGNFLHGFNTIAGMGAGSIDRNEGIQLQKAIGNLSLARSPEAIAQSLMDIKAGRERAKEALDAAIAEGPFAQPLRPKAGGAGKPRTLEQMRADAKRLRGG